MNLAGLSIRRPIFISCLVILVLIVGFISLKKLGVDLFPDVTLPVVSVQTVYPGASPNDVEEHVSKPIEDEIGGLAGMKRLTSSNLDSVSIVVAEFTLGTDIKEAEQQIRDRIANIRSKKLPREIDEPVIRRLDPADQPILRLAVKSSLPVVELFDVVDDNVKTALERIDGVANIDILGGRKREIHVLVDKKKLQERELSLLQVSNRIGAATRNVPVGKVEGTKSQNETLFRTLGEFLDLESLKRVNVNFLGSDRAVQLGDIGKVEEAAERETTRSALNGEKALFVDIFRQSGSNTVAVAEKVVKMIPKLNADLKAKGLNAEVSMVRDGAYAIRINVDDVKESIFIGIALCVVVVFFFLGSFRSTLITGMALPNSLLGAFILMMILGFTINIMTLLALSLAVGLLIDDAIVVRENIFRHMELGEKPAVAAERGTNEVALAVIATTLVVIAVFGPIAFLDGIVGQFFRQFGLTIVFAVAISLFDALTVAPMLSAAWATGAEHAKGTGLIARMLGAFDRFQSWLEDRYESLLKVGLRRPMMVLGSAVVIFFASLLLLKGIPSTFLPPADNGEFEVKLESPPGTSLEQMATIVSEVDAVVRKHPTVLLTASVTGTKNNEVNKGSIYVRLKSSKERQGVTTTDVKNYFRETLASFSNRASVKVQDYDAFGGGQRPFNLNLTGQDLDQLADYANKLKARMEKIPGLVDVDTNFRSGTPEFQVVFDRGRSEMLGVAAGTAGAELRARVEGDIPATYRKNGKEYDIRVRLRDEDQDLRKEFASTLVPNVNFNMIQLARVADPKDTHGFSQINRQNKGRFIQISGDIGKGGALGFIMQETTRIVTKEMPPPTGISWGFVGQAEDFADLISNMLLAMFLGITFIYLVLSSLYESFVTPLTILLALPLAVCGALAALFITQASINIFSMIGIVMLLGVVTKNSILLVDYTLHLTREGLSREAALIQASKTRLRPILMTSFALIAGTVPIAIGLNEASKQRTAMGIAIIGGLVSSTFLTLLVVPAAYGYIDDFRLWMGRRFGRKATELRAVENGHGENHLDVAAAE